jgi:dienelactone hydrolase
MASDSTGGLVRRIRDLSRVISSGRDSDDEADDWADYEEEHDWSGAVIRAPDTVPFDEIPTIAVANLKPMTEVTVRARMPMPDGIWSSWATYETDRRGQFDISQAEAIDGTYEGVDPGGLFWSMSPDARTDMRPADDRVTSVELELSIELMGYPVGETTMERVFADGVETERVERDGLVAEVHRPTSDGPHPGVLLVGGSEGGIPGPQLPMLLASKGYVVLAAAYFGTDALPEALEGIPMEYFETAVEWLGDAPAVSDSPYGVVGASRGGELALELGARTDEIGAVVGYVPSGVRFHGVPRGGRPDPAWTVDGDPLPSVPPAFPLSFLGQLAWRWLLRRPIRISTTYREGLARADEERIEAATIPVEQIDGPVLLVSAGDDGLWPSGPLSERAADRLAEAGHEYDHRHYERAGHGIGLPHAPAGSTTGGAFLPGVPMEMGGVPEANAEAAADAWRALLGTLDAGLLD